MRVSEHEDYMHFNTLSMVGSDGRESRMGRSLSTTAGTRRNRSWVSTLKDFAVGDRSDGRHSPVAEGANSPRRLKLRRSTPSFKGLNGGIVTAPQQTLGFTPREAESKPRGPRRAPSRSRTLPEGKSGVAATGHGEKPSTQGKRGETTDADTGNLKNPTDAHIHFSETKGDGPCDGQDESPIGRGRLTMTSRTGYFQDRVIPPSMVGFSVSTDTGDRLSDGSRLRCVRWPSCISQTGTRISAQITRCRRL